MAEYIEREALEKRINTGMNIIEVMQAIIDAPAADVIERETAARLPETAAARVEAVSRTRLYNIIRASMLRTAAGMIRAMGRENKKEAAP